MVYSKIFQFTNSQAGIISGIYEDKIDFNYFVNSIQMLRLRFELSTEILFIKSVFSIPIFDLPPKKVIYYFVFI